MKLESIHVLTDENISPKVVKCLRGQGLDVFDVKEGVRKFPLSGKQGGRYLPRCRRPAFFGLRWAIRWEKIKQAIKKGLGF